MQTLSSKPLDDYLKWPEVVFSVTGSQVAEITHQPQQVYGVIMDVGLSHDFIISVTAFASGEASLRTTVGGGAIGLSSDPFIAEQATEIITRAQSLALSASQINKHNLPTQKEIFFLLPYSIGLYAKRNYYGSTQLSSSPLSRDVFEVFCHQSSIGGAFEKQQTLRQYSVEIVYPHRRLSTCHL